MTVPNEIKWTTHRPVILAAPDWPDMPALKEHAAHHNTDVEVSPLVQSKHLKIVWVPAGFTGSAADAFADHHMELLTASMNEAAQRMNRLLAEVPEAVKALRPLADMLDAFNRRHRVSRLHRMYAAKRR